MFEGIINLQLPFMLISSGVSSVLYLIFLFINMGHPKPEEMANQDHQINFEKKQIAKIAISNVSDEKSIEYFDYFKNTESKHGQTLQVEDSFSLRLLTSIRHCNLKHTYSYLFAGASFCRPPPIA